MGADTASRATRLLALADDEDRLVPNTRGDGPDPLGEEFGTLIDRATHAAMARVTMGLSPASLAGAGLDWATHLATSPGRQMELAASAWRSAAAYGEWLAECASRGGRMRADVDETERDRRFVGPGWEQWPFNALAQSFLMQEAWWARATTGLPGVTRAHENAVGFTARQLLDLGAPTNFVATNPAVLARTVEQGGLNLLRGAQHWLEDALRTAARLKPAGADAVQVGCDVAATPGKVVYRNALIELIQYAPTTETVQPEPLLIVPAWIMKYYILDLAPHHSLVRFMRDQGFTVFMISWRNPGPEDRALGLDDYRRLGIMDALDAICAITGARHVHAAGYCLGGTLLAVAAAAMARDGDERLRSLTLFAAQTDFSEAGELMLFINEGQISFLEDLMWQQGYLEAGQMSGAFQLLRSNDLIWSRLVHEYLMGERPAMTELMAWNADATRMPARMHSEYLRSLFLGNDLAEGRFRAGSGKVAISDIRLPIFAVGTTRDHVAPWRSVHKLHLLTDAELTFVLTTGGHNAGIVADPDRPDRQYQVMTRKMEGRYLDPDTWAALAPHRTGSWWPEWARWLRLRSGPHAPPPDLGRPDAGYPVLGDAPGSYVFG